MEEKNKSPIYEEAEKDYIGGMKYKDIAEKYNVSINTVKSWKTRKWKGKKGNKRKNENCIYRFLDCRGKVIYIGQAQILKVRLQCHNHLPKKCYEETCKIEYVSFNTRDEMDLAERYYIPKIKPKYNDELKYKKIHFNIDIFDNAEWKTYIRE